jgi:hypothetical protein
MHQQSHTSPDGLLTLTSEPVLTIDSAHPKGFEDWIISIVPGDWHTHPDTADPEASTEQFIRDILEDRSILIVTTHNDSIDSVRPLHPFESLHQAIKSEQSSAISGWSVTFRLWSGKILASVP